MLNNFRQSEPLPTMSRIYEVPVFQYQPSIVAVQAIQSSAPTIFACAEAKRQIAALSGLEDNWDGFGAIKILDSTMKNAADAVDKILESGPFPTDIAPNSNGTVSFEWQTELGTAQLEVGRSRYSFFIDRLGGTSFLCDGSTNQILQYLGLLIASTLFHPQPGSAATITFAGNAQHTSRNL